MIIAGILRAIQILFAVVVLGLSITLSKGQVESSTPAQTSYAAFCGGWGILIALIGIVSLFVEPLQGIIILALDIVSTFLTIAGGVALAVALKGGSCYDELFLETNVIVRGAGETDGIPNHTIATSLTGRCQEAQADSAFLFFLFATFLATVVVSGMSRRNGGRSKTSWV